MSVDTEPTCYARPVLETGDFTQQAAAYARARPSYPREFVGRLLDAARVPAGKAIVEIGAGTGRLTRELVALGCRVIAVEPNAAMRDRAEPQDERVRWVDGTFERTDLPPDSAPWIVAAQAFHWADPPVALAELRRIAAPGARLTVMWNDRDNAASPMLTWTQQLIRDQIPEFNARYRDRDWSQVLGSTNDFADVSVDEARHRVQMTAARYVDLWRSHHRLTVAAGPDRMEAFCRLVAAELQRRGLHRLDVPYCCRAYSATARG
ncbi:MAG: class I SAM-dependent methyltransferase [Myxococcales bacterium FL481]|nr:MAG: class I SAM-dependent methyltransferase [Myxococcales bacterium FL481]